MVAGAGAGVTSKLSGTVTGAGAGAAPGAGAFTARAIGAGDVGAGAVGAEAAGIVVDSVVVETAGEVPGEASFANDAFRERIMPPRFSSPVRSVASLLGTVHVLTILTQGRNVELEQELDYYPAPDFSRDEHHIVFEGQLMPVTKDLLQRYLHNGTVSRRINLTSN